MPTTVQETRREDWSIVDTKVKRVGEGRKVSISFLITGKAFLATPPPGPESILSRVRRDHKLGKMLTQGLEMNEPKRKGLGLRKNCTNKKKVLWTENSYVAMNLKVSVPLHLRKKRITVKKIVPVLESRFWQYWLAVCVRE